MKVLLDEGVPHPLTGDLSAHDVETVSGCGWASVKNGKLLKLIADAKFDIFITGDKNIPAQQDLLGLRFAILILSDINWPVIRPHAQAIVTAVDEAQTGTITLIDCGQFRPQRTKPEHR